MPFKACISWSAEMQSPKIIKHTIFFGDSQKNCLMIRHRTESGDLVLFSFLSQTSCMTLDS